MNPENIFLRQLDILHPDEMKIDIGIVGCGGIGSPTALLLAKMGFPFITLYDFDLVEHHNLPNQWFRLEQVSKPKSEALKENIKYFTGTDVINLPFRWTPQTCRMHDVLIVGVDSMDERLKIWEWAKEQNIFYIEGRMGAELIRLYALNTTDEIAKKKYEKFLYPSSEAADVPCTARSIIYTTFLMAGLIGSQIKKFVKKEEYPLEVIFDVKTLTILT